MSRFPCSTVSPPSDSTRALREIDRRGRLSTPSARPQAKKDLALTLARAVKSGQEVAVRSGWPRRELDDVVSSIYRATTDHEQWGAIIERIGRRIGATIAAVHVHAHPGDVEPATTIGAWGKKPPVALRDYESHYAARNVWLQHGAHLMKPGAILTGRQMCPDDVLLRSEYYLEFLRPLDVRWSIRAVLTADPEPLSYFSAGRPERAHPFGEAERGILAAVTPHLMQAIFIQSRLETIQASRDAVSAALERLPLAVIFLDRRCRVVEMNGAARKLVDASVGVKVERGVLVAIDTRAEVQLQQMIFGAAALDTGRFLQHGGALSLPRSDGGHPLSAMVAPIGVTGLFPSSRSASVVVLIEQPTPRTQLPLAEFTRMHGLSPAETGIASRLVRGLSLRQAAAELGISDNTARSHLKHVFAKTGARRQSDLVRRALTYADDEKKPS